MSSAIIGSEKTAGRLLAALQAIEAEPVFIGNQYEKAGLYDILLLTDPAWTWADLIPKLTPHMRKGQTVLLGCGSLFGSWTITSLLFKAKAPLRTIVGMCDAWNGHPECTAVRADVVHVSAHNYVYNPFTEYVCGELFEDVRTAASPLALSFRADTLGWELAPLAEAVGLSSTMPEIRNEAVILGQRLGTEPMDSDRETASLPYKDLELSLRSATVNLYPMVKMAEAIDLPVPHLRRLLAEADRISNGSVSAGGVLHMPNPAQLLEHEHD